AANGGETMRRKGDKFVEKGGFSIVTAVVVSDRHQVKTGGEQAVIGASITAKDIRLGNRLTQAGDDALQVAYGEIKVAQKIGCVGERIQIVGCSRQHVTVYCATQHHITGKSKCDGCLWRGSRQRAVWCKCGRYMAGRGRCAASTRAGSYPAARQSEQ